MQTDKSKVVYKIPSVDLINGMILSIGKVVAWVNVLLIAVILTQVTLRYGFNNGLVYLEELIWHLYAFAMMFGLSYAYVNNSHIRVDLIHMNLSNKAQHIIEILGIVCLLLPFVFTLIHHSIEWVFHSYTRSESSSSPTGLPYRWVIKSVLPLSMILLALAAIARLIRSFVLLRYLRGGRRGSGWFDVVEEIHPENLNSSSDTDEVVTWN